MPKKTPQAPVISGTVADLEDSRMAEHRKASAAIAALHETAPLTLARRAALRNLAAIEETIYRITVALEAQDPDWKAACLSGNMRAVARMHAQMRGASVPEWAYEPLEDPAEAQAHAASLWDAA